MNDELAKFKYGLVACTKIDDEQISILHFCGYERPPTEEDIKALELELNTDPEFHLVGRVGQDVFIIRATQDMCDFYLSNAGHPAMRSALRGGGQEKP
jgi:hypothetical protein